MPWNEDRLLSAMRHLSPFVRSKAIGIANALLADGQGEGRSIRIGIAQARAARAWAPRPVARPRRPAEAR
jgi:uncharacterized protein YdaT